MERVSLTVQGHTIDVLKYPLAESHIYLWSCAKALVSLLADFRKCPAADDLLSRVASRNSLILEQNLDPNELTYTMYTDVGPWIVMAPGEEDPLASLAFELFNAKGGTNTTLVVKGEQNIDEYAKHVCTEDYALHQGRKKIAKRCYRDWGKGYDYLKKFKKAPSSLEEFLFAAEWHCTMDGYRAIWQEKYKPAFCKLHPKDPECIGPPRELCDAKLFHFFARQSEDTKNWMRQRFCDLFSRSSKELQYTLQKKTFWQTLLKRYCSYLPKEAKTDL